MDKILGSFEEKSPGQKILITLGISLLLIVFLAASYIFTTPKQNNTEQPSTSEAQIPQTSSFPVNNPASQKNKTYTSPYFSVSYPSSYSYQEGQVEGDSQSFSLLLKPAVTNQEKPVIEFQIYGPGLASQSAIESVFTALNYKKSNATVSGITAVMYKGSVPSGNLTLSEEAVVFTYLNRVYKVQLTYTGKEDTGLENIFSSVVSAIKLPSGF